MALESWVWAIKINEPVLSFLNRDQVLLAFPQGLKSRGSVWDDSLHFKTGRNKNFPGVTRTWNWMIADHLIPSCESAKLNVAPYLVTLQDLLSQVWRNTSRGLHWTAQKRRVLAVRWQEQEQCLSAQFQWRLNLGGRIQAISLLSALDLSDEYETGVGGSGRVVRMFPSGLETGGDELWIWFTSIISSSGTEVWRVFALERMPSAATYRQDMSRVYTHRIKLILAFWIFRCKSSTSSFQCRKARVFSTFCLLYLSTLLEASSLASTGL
jgi:hypothetical protein